MAQLRSPQRVRQPSSRRRGEPAPCTGVHGRDPLQAQTAIGVIKRRINSAIEAAFNPTDREFQWWHSNKRQYLAGLRRMPSLRDQPQRLAIAFTQHYSSYATRSVLALCALKKKRPSPLGREVVRIEDVARQMDTRSRAIPVCTTRDSDGSKTRTVHSYDVVDYARQLALSDFISCVGPSPYFDFCAPGAGGRDAHIRHIRQLVANGYTQFLTADIRQAFPSVRPHDVVNLLSIPEWAVENILFSEDAHDVWTNNTMNALDPNASCGLPQGSVCSGSAWSMVAGSILRPLAGDRWDISLHVDDVLASARSRPELEHLRRQMEEEFLRVSCGRLRFGRMVVVDLRREPLDFLGYRISLLPERQVWVRPSPAAWQKAESRCYDRLQGIYNSGLVPDAGELLEEAESYFRRWISSHGEWRPSHAGIKQSLLIRNTSDVWHRFCWDYDVPMPDPV